MSPVKQHNEVTQTVTEKSPARKTLPEFFSQGVQLVKFLIAGNLFLNKQDHFITNAAEA